MTKLSRLLALAAVATLAPAAGAAAQGPYTPQQPPTQQPPTTPPADETGPVTPRDLAGDLRADTIEELGSFRNLRAVLITAKRTPITVAVNGAGTYTVQLRRKVGRRTVTLSRGSLNVRNDSAPTRDLRLGTTASGRRYVRGFKGQKLKITIRTGFKPAGAKKTTWVSKASTFDLRAKKSKR